jgi:hypothetical protein
LLLKAVSVNLCGKVTSIGEKRRIEDEELKMKD